MCRSRVVKWVAIGLGVALLIAIGVVGYLIDQSYKLPRPLHHLTYVKQVGVAAYIYAQDHDDRFPPVFRSEEDIKHAVLHSDPGHGHLFKDSAYGYLPLQGNEHLELVRLSEIEAPDQTLMIWSEPILPEKSACFA